MSEISGLYIMNIYFVCHKEKADINYKTTLLFANK